MMYKIIKEKFIIAKAVIAILFGTILLIFGKYSATGVSEGLYMCGQVLIPSLFPFMVLASFTVRSGLSDYMGQYLGFISKWIFGVSEICSATILLSFIGGYPVGAKGIAELYNSGKISEDDATKLSYSLVAAGPGFLCIFVGTTLLNCRQIGNYLLIAQILSVLIIGFINNLIFRNTTYSANSDINIKSDSVGDSIIESVRSCTYTMLEMCGIVVLFSAFISILEKSSYFIGIYKYIATILEVTSSCRILANEWQNIILLAFAVGFGGLSVHFQIFHTLKNISINKLLFIFFRFLQGIITSVIFYIFITLFPVSVPVFSSVSVFQPTLSTSVMGSALLLITGLCFLYSIKNYKN